MRGPPQIGPDLAEWHSKDESATREQSKSKAGSRAGVGAGGSRRWSRTHGTCSPSAACTGRSGVNGPFYSHPAVVDVDDPIRHFPEHRKVALLADEPSRTTFNTRSRSPRRPTPLASHRFPRLRSWPGDQQVGYIFTHRALPGRSPSRSEQNSTALGSGSLPTARAARPAALRLPRPAPLCACRLAVPTGRGCPGNGRSGTQPARGSGARRTAASRELERYRPRHALLAACRPPSDRWSWIGGSTLAARRRVSGGRDRLPGRTGVGTAGRRRLDRLGFLLPGDRHAPRLGRLGDRDRER
jgi:hypothetical protein